MSTSSILPKVYKVKMAALWIFESTLHLTFLVFSLTVNLFGCFGVYFLCIAISHIFQSINTASIVIVIKAKKTKKKNCGIELLIFLPKNRYPFLLYCQVYVSNSTFWLSIYTNSHLIILKYQSPHIICLVAGKNAK